MTEALSISAVRCDTKTHWKLTMKELQGQTRTSKLVCLLPSFSSFSFSESLVILLVAQHLQLVQGQAELEPAGAAKWSSRQ